MKQLTTKENKPAGKVAILVLGMHRSGTSALTGILDRLGCKGPKNLFPPSDGNPRGYFEGNKIAALNDEILSTLGIDWRSWSSIDPDWHLSPRFLEYRDRIIETIRSEFGQASLIYIKDPRLCRLLPLWREALVETGFDVNVVLTHRNPVDVARSLEKRERAPIAPGTGPLIWLRHVLDAEPSAPPLPSDPA